MKVTILATTLAMIWSAAALAIDASPGARLVPVREVVPHLESRYQGEVVAIALDAAGDKAAHYHVDLRYPDSGTAKIDVDAQTLEITARVQPQSEDGWTSLPGAAALAATLPRGEVIAAELDAIDSASPHYDVDVRLPGGEVARLKVDPKTQRLGWCTPPVVMD
jgi:uncharacterized membrane protein YkoI